MRLALSLARQGLCTTHPNPRVGCVVAHGETVVGTGWHRRAGDAHAEINALQSAGKKAYGATVYVTLEPCAHHGRTRPCVEALISAGVARIVAAQLDPNPLVQGKGVQCLRAAGIAVKVGVLAKQAKELNRGYWLRHTAGRPLLTLKVAQSLDGRTALANGDSQWISSTKSRTDGHRLRSESSAILTGIGTVIADNPRLTVRLPENDTHRRQANVGDPPVVVLDSRLRIPLTAALFATRAPLWIATTTKAPADALERLSATGAEILLVASNATGGIDLNALMTQLAVRGCNQLLAECGATLAGALITAQLVDELVVYLAPRILGADACPMAAISGNQDLNALRFQLTTIQRCGQDVKMCLRHKT